MLGHRGYLALPGPGAGRYGGLMKSRSLIEGNGVEVKSDVKPPSPNNLFVQCYLSAPFLGIGPQWPAAHHWSCVQGWARLLGSSWLARFKGLPC